MGKWLGVFFVLFFSGHQTNVLGTDVTIPKNGTIIVKRILRNYYDDWKAITDSCPCTYVYGYNDTCPQYFNKKLIRKLFPFISNVDSFISTYGGNMVISSKAVERGMREMQSVGYLHILEYGFQPIRNLYAPNSEQVIYTFPDSKSDYYYDDRMWSPGSGIQRGIDSIKTVFDTLKFYGRERLGLNEYGYSEEYCLLVEEKVTITNGQITKRELLSISFGTDLADGSRTVFTSRVKAQELIGAFQEIDKGRASKAYEYFRSFQHKPENFISPNTEFLGNYSPNFPYEPLNFWRSYAHPAVFSEYIEIDGKPFAGRQAMLKWLNQPDNPFRLQKPNIKGKKGHFLVRFRVLDLINIRPL